MSHFYDRITGKLFDRVEMKTRPGEYRDYNLGDARKDNSLPSVTTVLTLLSKPGLVRWQVEQGIKTTLTSTELLEEQPDVQAIYNKSQEYVRWTADFGTAVHEWLRIKLQGITPIMFPVFPKSEEVADGVIEWMAANGFEVEQSEYHFVRPDLGYGGTVDMIGTHYGEPAIWDIKTQEPPLTPYDPDYPLQLAGYDLGLYQENTFIRERISLIANRLNPGEVHPHLWVDKGSTVALTNLRYDAMFNQLLGLWFMVNRFDPREIV